MTKKSFTYLVAGIVFGLMFSLGLGMCMIMVWQLMIPGILIGIVGMVGVAAAYPLYLRITKKEQERIAPEILRLSEELLK